MHDTLEAPPEQAAPPSTEGPQSPIYGPSDTLYFKGHPVRILPIDGVPWFVLPDLCDALGFNHSVMAEVDAPYFPTFAKRLADEDPEDEGEGEPQEVTVLSPVGVWYFTTVTDPGRGQSIAAWAKREAFRMCPAPAPRDPAMFLRVLSGPEMPPYPWRYSGRRSEWEDLRYSAEYNQMQDEAISRTIAAARAARASRRARANTTNVNPIG